MKLIDQLIAVRAVLTLESAWTKGVAAINECGEPVPTHSDEAVCFCLYGAARRIVINHARDPNSEVISFIMEHLKVAGYGNFAEYNDAETTTHQDVLDFIDALIFTQLK